MQKELNKLKSLYNEVIELIILQDFKNLVNKIIIIKKILENIEQKAISWEIKKQNSQEKNNYSLLTSQIKQLEERVLKLEKLKNPSMQIIEKEENANNWIWN